MGWLDSDMNAMEEVIQADVATLPTGIQDALNGDGYTECLQTVIEKLTDMGSKYIPFFEKKN